MKDQQTLFKHAAGYYQLHKKKLLEQGYVIVEDDDELTIFRKGGDES